GASSCVSGSIWATSWSKAAISMAKASMSPPGLRESEPGGILVSGSAFNQVKKKIETRFEDLGRRTLKNIGETVRIYRPDLGRQSAEVPPALTPPDKPSIAVLPFENLSADPEQAYFADGLTEDLITDLSKVPSLFVIARNSSFAYKGRSMDVRHIAWEL